MKQRALFLLLFLASAQTYALQHTDDQQNSAVSGSNFGGTFGPVFKMSQFGSGLIGTLGARVNATLFKMLLLGISGHGKIFQSKLDIDGKSEDNLSYYYGGLGLGVRLFPASFIHLTNYNTFGIGRLNLPGQNARGLVYSIEPELNVELDFLIFFRVGAGVSYRWMFSKDINVPSSQMSGFGGQLYVEFGWL